ncbi:MAG: hypothetical protein R3E32_03275 [Chitinophagales bacterium]
MILENRHPLNSFQVKGLEKIIQGKLIGIKNNKMSLHKDSMRDTHYFYCNKLMLYFKKGDEIFVCIFWCYYKMNEILMDELCYTNIGLRNFEMKMEYKDYFDSCLFEGNNVIVLPNRFYQHHFVVKQIKIYGENRICKWQKRNIDNYFKDFPSEEKPQKVYDYLLTTNIIIIENELGDQLLIGGSRGDVSFGITKDYENNPNYTNNFYRKDELILGFGEEEKSAEEIWEEMGWSEEQWEEDRKKRELANKTTVPRTRLLYQFSEQGVERFDSMKYSNYRMFFEK